MTSIELTAPAKVNLFLKVLDRRKDSYHNILTLFARISLADKITISKAPKGIKVSSDKFITRRPEENIAYKAAQLLIRHKRLKSGVRVGIKKNIPIGAGLGGGSSDAAAVLMGMNRLFNLKITKKGLARLAGQLGADVPFFVSGYASAIGRARGERLTKAGLKAPLWYLVIYPGFKLSAKGIYEAFDALRPGGLTRAAPGVKIRLSSINRMDLDGIEAMLYNDLQEIAVLKRNIIGNIIERLANTLGKKAILTGSGPSVFCLYGTRKEAMGAKRRFLRFTPAALRNGWRMLVARTGN